MADVFGDRLAKFRIGCGLKRMERSQVSIEEVAPGRSNSVAALSSGRSGMEK